MSRRGYVAAVVGGLVGFAALSLAGFLLSVTLSDGICGLDEIAPSCNVGELWFHFLWTAGGGYLGMVSGCLMALRVRGHARVRRTAGILAALGLIGAIPWTYLFVGIVSLAGNVPMGTVLTVGTVTLGAVLARRLGLAAPESG